MPAAGSMCGITSSQSFSSSSTWRSRSCFPWAVALKGIGAFGFWSMIAFLGVLTVGFIYEWCKGALEWE